MNRPRYRILFSKTEAMRFTGHLDLHRAWERLLRRARVPLEYSSGYHPHPKIRIGAALPLGVTGENELADIETYETCDAEELARRIENAAPPGIQVRGVTALPENAPGLEQLVRAGDYSALPLEGAWPADLPQRIERLLASAALPRERRGKRYDLRPRILSLALEGDTPALAKRGLRMRLSLTPEATGRPDEVLAALGMENLPVEIRRERILIQTDDVGYREV